MTKLIDKISDLGIVPDLPETEQRYIRITNLINIAFVFIVSVPLIFIILFLTGDGADSYNRFILMIFFCLSNLLLNAMHKYTLAKILTAIMPVFCIVVMPIFVFGFIHPGMFLWFPYGIMICGAVSFFIFSLEKEKLVMTCSLLFHMLMVFTYDELLFALFHESIDLSFVRQYYIPYVFAKIVICIFFYAMLLLYKLVYHESRRKISLLSQELKCKNDEMQVLNSILEIRVAERTDKLALQNGRIKNLAFTNAHEIRAYTSRILGLLHVFEMKISEEEREFCLSKLKESAEGLDLLTKKISTELIEEHYGDQLH
ncbi:MAG TPA: hypothetical protein VL947_03340 [Cytophagales bacterium]|nr:hypothetical protein [Cytophagales bacterium]